LKSRATPHQQLARKIYSVWLFTRSDLKTIIGPSTAFGISNALANSAYYINLPVAYLTKPSTLFLVAAITIFWAWINLLPLAIDNQITPKAIAEDTFNKPWRTLPSKRMTIKQAGALRIPLYGCAVISSWYLGGLRQCLLLGCLAIWYNHYGGGDCNPLVRNFINSVGYICYTSGALEVALGNNWLPGRAFPWFSVIGLVVFSTVQIQDFSDQEGDSQRGRKTLPLQIGDSPARYVSATLMIFWSSVCVWFWRLHTSIICGMPVLAVGLYIAYRLFTKRSVQQDRATFRFWNLWMVILFVLPLMHTSIYTSEHGSGGVLHYCVVMLLYVRIAHARAMQHCTVLIYVVTSFVWHNVRRLGYAGITVIDAMLHKLAYAGNSLPYLLY